MRSATVHRAQIRIKANKKKEQSPNYQNLAIMVTAVTMKLSYDKYYLCKRAYLCDMRLLHAVARKLKSFNLLATACNSRMSHE